MPRGQVTESEAKRAIQGAIDALDTPEGMSAPEYRDALRALRADIDRRIKLNRPINVEAIRGRYARAPDGHVLEGDED
jgi:hypothetical protein